LVDATDCAAVIFPCETWANIVGMRNVEKTSSMAGFIVPG
jgi:hypothetical protein